MGDYLKAIRKRRLTILDAPVDDLTMDEAVSCVEDMILHGGTHQVTVMNANKLWLMRKDPELEAAVLRSSLLVPEWAVVWAGSALGRPVRAHVGGLTLVKALLPVAAERGYRIFLLGARLGTLTALVSTLRRDYPGIQICGSRHGYIGPAEEDNIVGAIRASHADLLFVARGSPLQEHWIARYLEQLGVPVAIGVGGTFDVLAGLRRDTPPWMRGRGLEWFYRLMQNPRSLWRRYLTTNTWFIYRVLRARLGA